MQTEPTFELIVVEGRRKWLCSNGRILPYVAGGSGDGDPPPKPPAPPEPKPGDPPPKTFSQEEMNAIIASRLTGARDKARDDILKEMGVTDPEQAKALIAAAKAAEDANATELDKAKKVADEEKDKSARATAELEDSKLTTAVEKALVKAGLTIEAAERVRKMVTVDKNETEAITAAVEDLKKEMPSLFTPQGAGGPPGHNPGSPPPGGAGKPNDPQAVALETLYERHPKLKKT